jgi:hypothetical protein
MKKSKNFKLSCFKRTNLWCQRLSTCFVSKSLGQLVSISKGLIGSLKFSAVERDIFVEIIK